MPNRLQLRTSPTDSFIEYFLDTKPYHTKLLDIVETYTFSEEMVVSFKENIQKDILIENDPLCKPTGFGLDYDDECGYDAIDCCDLFDCYGGYGLIFDNSDNLVDLDITTLQVENIDTSVLLANDNNGLNSFVEVSGNHLTDVRIPLKRVPDPNTLVVDGNLSTLFDIHKTFVLVNVQQFEIDSNTGTTVFISGNHESFFSPKNTFFVLGQDKQNSQHFYSSASFNPSTNMTELHLSVPIASGELEGFTLQIPNSSPNIGIYQTDTNSYDAIADETTINLITGSTSEVLLEGDYKLGSIQLRTALKSPRLMEIVDTDTNEEIEYRILHSEYDDVSGVTRIYPSGTLEEFTNSTNLSLKTYGYFFEPGFDGGAECTPPKAENIHTGMHEFLFIDVEDF